MTAREKNILEKMERELNLKQLQIKSLLAITQAINENVSAAGLYNMYKSFMSWEMGVGKMALFVRDDDHWKCAVTSNVQETIDETLWESVLFMSVSSTFGWVIVPAKNCGPDQ